MKTKIIQITAGRGPEECCWVVAQVVKHFNQNLKDVGITAQLLHRVPGNENGALRSVTLQLQGNELDTFLSTWLGTIQWIGKSNYRKFHKRKNWFIGLFEIESIPPIRLTLDQIRFQAIRSSGPGGQHANKVSSAVRATHLKTGQSVLVSDTRSQHQNKKIALERLQNKLSLYQNEKLKSQAQNQWENHLDLERGNPTRVFTGTDFKTIKKKKSYKAKRRQLKHELYRSNDRYSE